MNESGCDGSSKIAIHVLAALLIFVFLENLIIKHRIKKSLHKNLFGKSKFQIREFTLDIFPIFCAGFLNHKPLVLHRQCLPINQIVPGNKRTTVVIFVFL